MPATEPSSYARFLQGFADHLDSRREAILRAWMDRVERDPDMTTVDALSRDQFRDHIPGVLDAFAAKLRGSIPAVADDVDGATTKAALGDAQALVRQDAAHGLHRWQQGYRLRELIQEWSHLQVCLIGELDRWIATQMVTDAEIATNARRELSLLMATAVGESADQYTRADRAEAAGHARDLQRALTEINDLDRRRMELFRQTAHDLGGSVNAVGLSTLLLDAQGLSEEERAEYVGLLQNGVELLRSTLGEMMDLARLEAGQERRQVKPFNAGQMLQTLCDGMQPFARQRGLVLESEGPAEFPVDGDAAKIQRIAQNLLVNALKYTEQGRVCVAWKQKDAIRWQLSVQDTGPGISQGPGAPIARAIHEATVSGRQAQADRPEGPSAESPGQSPLPTAAKQQPGEGIGLSIVKRLCELLDATLELESGEHGTTFSILFPCNYPKTAHPLPS